METFDPSPQIRAVDARAIGNRIERTRQGLFLSKRALARWARISADRLAELESGKAKRLGLEEVAHVADALGLRLDALVFGPEEPDMEARLEALERSLEALRAEKES
jgi:transcriptional regulator with XRE-family HTH domain